MKTAVGTLKSDLQQFRELEAFAAFGSDLDAVSKAQLERGYRLTELLKQGINSPMPVEQQCVVIFAGTRGHLDDIATEDVGRFADGLLEWFTSRHGVVLDAIKDSGKIEDEDAFEQIIKDYAEQFVSSTPSGDTPEAEAQAEADSTIKSSARHLPEEEIERGESDSEASGSGAGA